MEAPCSHAKELNVMMTRIWILGAGVLTLAMTPPASAECKCHAKPSEGGVWCEDCKSGAVADLQIHSRRLFDALMGTAGAPCDPVNCPCKDRCPSPDCCRGACGSGTSKCCTPEECAKHPECKDCGKCCSVEEYKAAMQAGACGGSALKAAAGRSSVAARLAAGSKATDRQPGCAACRKSLGRPEAVREGWCDACNAGVVHGRVYEGKGVYEAAKSAYNLLVSAVKVARECEDCATALVTGGTCTKCHRSFKGGAVAAASNG